MRLLRRVSFQADDPQDALTLAGYVDLHLCETRRRTADSASWRQEPTPAMPTGALVPEGTPALLFQAYSVVSTTTEQEMASRDLAAALGRNANTRSRPGCRSAR
ncbi:hypothetical protein ACH4UM_40700 [Streptomyces sp. NPDC020801]|uniref:hypothetical protein n=1 Tax=Streptomyces sp. NPDC020801 TaxID=3365093 RepID=UPI0037A8667B